MLIQHGDAQVTCSVIEVILQEIQAFVEGDEQEHHRQMNMNSPKSQDLKDVVDTSWSSSMHNDVHEGDSSHFQKNQILQRNILSNIKPLTSLT